MDIDVGDFLNRVRTSVTGCGAVALVDLEANMVLTEECEITIGQEIWDFLALKAIELLVGANALVLANTVTAKAGKLIRYARLRRDDDVFLLLRSETEPPLGLMCICNRQTPIERLVDAAREELEALASTS